MALRSQGVKGHKDIHNSSGKLDSYQVVVSSHKSQIDDTNQNPVSVYGNSRGRLEMNVGCRRASAINIETQGLKNQIEIDVRFNSCT